MRKRVKQAKVNRGEKEESEMRCSKVCRQTDRHWTLTNEWRWRLSFSFFPSFISFFLSFPFTITVCSSCNVLFRRLFFSDVPSFLCLCTLAKVEAFLSADKERGNCKQAPAPSSHTTLTFYLATHRFTDFNLKPNCLLASLTSTNSAA